MLIALIAALLGIWMFRSKEYFKWVIATYIWIEVSGLLFYAGGTLENPAGDGIITHQLRIASNDEGPLLGLFAVVFLVVFYGGIIYLLTRMFKAAGVVRKSIRDAPDEGDGKTPKKLVRKLMETVGLWILFAFAVNFSNQISAQFMPSSPPPTEELPTALTIEQELLGIAAEINATSPKQIDDATTLIRASASSRTLSYYYQLDPSSADRDSLISFIQTDIIPKVCAGELRPSIKDFGVSYNYNYTGEDISPPVEVTIDEALCASLED